MCYITNITHCVLNYTLCVKLHTICGIELHRGSCRVQYGKNSPHLKNFTPTPLVALVTIMRYVWVRGEWAVGHWIVGILSFQKIYGLYGLKHHTVDLLSCIVDPDF